MSAEREEKYCPLFVIGHYAGSGAGTDISCDSCCAWWDDQRQECAVLTIAKAASDKRR